MSHTAPVTPSTYGFFQGMLKADINPANNKSKTLVMFNPFNKYGRTFHLAWISFFVAFLSWFAFPPLLHGAIKTDMKLTAAQTGNSNIVGLLATLVVRLIVGPLCDRFGPRYVMAGVLLAGAIPTACVPAIKTVGHLYTIRFFVGILGGTFVPCVVWTTQFFDKSIVGRANALAGGWGNAGGGVTFFVMPAVVTAFQSNGYSLHNAWRLAFPSCPLIIIIVIAALVLIFGHDTPTGPWRTRHLHAGGKAVDVESMEKSFSNTAGSSSPQYHGERRSSLKKGEPETAFASSSAEDMQVGTIIDEIPQAPTFGAIIKTMFSPQVLLVALTYLCSFGSELAVEGVISNFYIAVAKAEDKKKWGEELAGQWAAMFGLLNVFTRPLGGYISDKLYARYGVTSKKWFLLSLNLMQGIFFIWIGLVQGLKVHSLIGAMAGLAIFMEAANGANFSLVPHIHPEHNGVVSGFTGAMGNLGGVFFNLAFRFEGATVPHLHKAMWVIGVAIVGTTLAVSWVPMKNVIR